MVATKTRWPEYPVWLGNTTLGQIRMNAKEMKLGDKDGAQYGAVRLVQEAVRHWGLTRKNPPADLFAKYGPDGTYGSETVSAVKAFQRNSKDAAGIALADDGIVGDLTLSALDRLIAPAKAPAPPAPPPTPKKLTVLVDFVVFDDGGSRGDVETMLEAANEVYGPIGIRLERGDVIVPSAQSNALASAVFWNNRTNGLPDPKKSSSVVKVATARQDFPLHAEVRALARRANRRRPTAYLVAPFPPPVLDKGATYTPDAHKVESFVMLIPNDRRYRLEAFWHELGHVLLDSLGTDHSIHQWEELKGPYDGKDKEWLMTTPPEKRLRGAYIPPKAIAKMQHTARTKFQ